MIVLSAGLPKSGSAWYFNLTNDLLVAAGHQDVRAVRQRYHLHSVIKYATCQIDSASRLAKPLILVPHFLGNTFVIKTHAAPTGQVRALISAGIAEATYIYRDPRDAAVSAFEHGCRLREEGKTHSFAKLDTMEAAIRNVQRHLEAWDAWVKYGRALMVRYEDLLADPVEELERLADYLALDVPTRVLPQIATTYQPANLPQIIKEKGRLHFHKGITGRFREIMTGKHLDLCRQQFGDYLTRMGYDNE